MTLRRAIGGGTVAQWRSLDHGGPVAVWLEDDLHEDWEHLPLYWDSVGNYRIFVWQPSLSAVDAPPDDLGPEAADEAFREILAESFDDMNAKVAASVAASRNAPPAAPSAPGAKRFVRIASDYGIDSDGDGSPDWAEFEIMADSQHPSHALADPFSADRDGDGTADGRQIDLDGDGLADGRDAFPGDSGMAFARDPLWRYAVFDLGSREDTFGFPSPPLMVNLQGRVLYTSGVWQGGVYTPLQVDNEGQILHCRAWGMNDHGQILGEGLVQRLPSDDPDEDVDPVIATAPMPMGLAWWSQPAAAPVPVEKPGSFAESLWPGSGSFETYPHDNILDNDGRFVAWHRPGMVGDYKKRLWKKNASGAGFSVTIDPRLEAEGYAPAFVSAPDLVWGHLNAGTRILGASGSEDLNILVQRVSSSPPGSTLWDSIAFGGGVQPHYQTGSQWKASEGLRQGRDLSANGVAVFSSQALWQAGTLLPFPKWAPELDQSWAGLSLKDAAPTGWIVGTSGNQGALAMPVLPEDDEEATGVDTFSLTSPVGCDMRGDWKAWIMVPAGGATNGFRLASNASPENPVTVEGSDVIFGNGSGGVTLDNPFASLSLKSNTASTSDGALTVKLGGLVSASKPIGVKVMKKRVVRVAVYKVNKLKTDGTLDVAPILTPGEAELRNYLDSVFSPQINVSFQVKVMDPPLAVNWEAGTPDGILQGNDGQGNLSSEQGAIVAAMNAFLNANPEQAAFGEHIKIFVAGTSRAISGTAVGVTSRETRTCWLIGNYVSRNQGGSPIGISSDNYLRTIAHELGHIFVGPGHPDTQIPGQAPLPESDHSRRLMVSGPGEGPNPGKLLVKGEWDEAEKWLAEEERQGRLGQ